MIRRIILGTVLLTLATPVFADEEACVTLGKLSAGIMQARQIEAPLSDVMALANESIGDPVMADYIKNLVIEAYKRPAYRSVDNQEQAVKEFRNEMELFCYQSLSD